MEGVKDSGLGREGLRYAIEEMTEPETFSHEFTVNFLPESHWETFFC